jgi:hypothetical protein
MIQKTLFIITACLLWINSGYSQSSFTLTGGFSNSIFYSKITKAEYRHSFTSNNAYLVNFSYRENLSTLQKNLQVGAQVEFKRQSAWFYYEDLFPTDTFATGVNFDIHSINLYLFPEIKVGESVKFVFSGGPVLQYIINVKAEGKRIERRAGNPNIETEINDKNSKEISGFCFGAKINLGIEIPIYKNLYITFYNSYAAGLTGMKGDLSKRMKYFNCVDINISGGIVYVFNHKNWFEKQGDNFNLRRFSKK